MIHGNGARDCPRGKAHEDGLVVSREKKMHESNTRDSPQQGKKHECSTVISGLGKNCTRPRLVVAPIPVAHKYVGG